MLSDKFPLALALGTNLILGTNLKTLGTNLSSHIGNMKADCEATQQIWLKDYLATSIRSPGRESKAMDCWSKALECLVMTTLQTARACETERQ